MHDEAEANCSSNGSSMLIPLRVLKNINVSVVIETLDINETAWIGGEHYNIGCENETEDHLNRLCRDVVHERLPVNLRLNYSCVQGTTDVTVVMHSTKPKSFANSSSDCHQSSRLPDLNVIYPLYRLPSEIQMSDSGPQWFGTFDDVLKNSLIRRCRIVTKLDECSLSIEYDECENTLRRGICFGGTQFHSALDFNIFRERSVENSSQTETLTGSSLCYVTTETASTETEPDLSSTTDKTESSTVDLAPSDQTNTTTEVSDVTPKTETDQSTRAEDTKTTQQTVPPPKITENEPASSNLWVIAVVLIVLLVVAILVMIVIRKRRMSKGMRPGNENRNHTSMFEVTASVVGSFEKRHWSATIPSGTNSAMEVLGRDMFQGLDTTNIELIELDNECKNTQRTDCDVIQRISVKSENENCHVMPYEIKSKMDKVQEETRTISPENNQETLNDEKSGLMIDEDVPLENT